MNKKKKIVDDVEEEDERKVFASCTFSSLGLHPNICQQLQDRMEFESPTLVQAQAIPVILSGRHVLVSAPTGTGKTVTYLAPIIHYLHQFEPRIHRSDGTFALVLVPTHELCMQVYENLQKLLHRFHWIVPGYIMGGESRSKEKARLRKGISILVATPGRLLDHLKNTSSFLHTKLRWIVFDEADRILELGYRKEIEEILEILGTRLNTSVTNENEGSGVSEVKRQILLLSATLNENVNHLARISLDNPVMIGLDKKAQPILFNGQVRSSDSNGDGTSNSEKVSTSLNEGYKLPSQLVQRCVKVPCGSRLVVLLSILKNLFENEASQKVVVFFSTCDAVDFHYKLLNQFQWLPKPEPELEQGQLFVGCKTLRLHGTMKHADRTTTFRAFKTEKSALLLSTDVSARGLDFPNVKCIIQYDCPGEATEYVHRVGRTARLGEKGESLLFLQPVEIDYLKDLEKNGVVLTEYPLLKLLDSFQSNSGKHKPKKFVTVEAHPWVLSLQASLETFISAEPKMKLLAQSAFCSWVRAYSAHRGDLKRIFYVKKLHLGHVARSFVLKDQPSWVAKKVQMKTSKRKAEDKPNRLSKKRRIGK